MEHKHDINVLQLLQALLKNPDIAFQVCTYTYVRELVHLWVCVCKSKYICPHIIQGLYCGTWSQVRTADGMSEAFEVQSGVRQGCVLSPLLF